MEGFNGILHKKKLSIKNVNKMIEEVKEKAKIKVAVLGGSFDPPTISHLQLASETLNVCAEIDEVWLIPCGVRSDKKLGASPQDRY